MHHNTENLPLPLSLSSTTSEKARDKPKSLAPLQPSLPNSEQRAVKRLGKFEFCLDQKIGSGMSGDAYVGVDTERCELVCVKVIDREAFRTEQQLLLDNEIRCQQACSSPHTVQILEVFATTSFCFIVTEFCEGGDLYRCLRASPHGLPEPLVLHFGRQIALALLTLKNAGIIHRDIKSENVLIQKNMCKLGDFGFAIEQK